MKSENSKALIGQIPAKGNWLDIHVMEYHVALKQNEATFHVLVQKDFQGVLSEKKQGTE